MQCYEWVASIMDNYTTHYTFKTLETLQNALWILEIINIITFYIIRLLFLHTSSIVHAFHIHISILSHRRLDWILGVFICVFIQQVPKLGLLPSTQNTLFPLLPCSSEKEQNRTGPWCVFIVINLEQKVKKTVVR